MNDKKYKVISVLDKLKKECKVDYCVNESGPDFLDATLFTCTLNKLELDILNELNNFSDFVICVYGNRFWIAVEF